MIVVGIVGSPAGGKSTVGTELAALGATWLDADQVAREVLERDEIQERLIKHFGGEITGDHGRIVRSKLADVVFGADDSKRAALTYLESVIHPPTRAEMRCRIAAAALQGSPMVLLDVPLLFESGWDRSCDEIWCVDAPFGLRAARAASRGWDVTELQRRESRQLRIAEKKRLSNRVIDNGGTVAELTSQLRTHYGRLIEANRQTCADAGHCVSDN